MDQTAINIPTMVVQRGCGSASRIEAGEEGVSRLGLRLVAVIDGSRCSLNVTLLTIQCWRIRITQSRLEGLEEPIPCSRYRCRCTKSGSSESHSGCEVYYHASS
jgi:hypothetical protein